MPPILVRLPAHLEALLEQRRGDVTRAAFLAMALAAHLGVTSDAPRRGRPKKAAPCVNVENIEIPEINWLRVVKWMTIIDSLPYHSTPEEPKTLYISSDGQRMRWAYSEKDSATAKSLSRIIKNNGGNWSGGSWVAGSPETASKVRAKATATCPPWTIAALEDIEVDGWEFATIHALNINDKAVVVRIDCAPLREFAKKYAQNVRGFLSKMFRMWEVSWFHDETNKDIIFSLPIEINNAIEKLSDLQIHELVNVEMSTASAAELRAWTAQPVLTYRDHGMVNASLKLGNPLHRVLLSKAAAATKPGYPVEPNLILGEDQWREAMIPYEALGGRCQEQAHPSRFNIALRPERIAGWDRPAKNSYTFFQHQREGIQFLLNHHMRGMLGDEMGLGKTGTVIGAAVACQAKRVLVIAPAVARSVWDSEIRGWAGDVEILHIEEGSNSLMS